jgi:hypothetical protein
VFDHAPEVFPLFPFFELVLDRGIEAAGIFSDFDEFL